MGLDLSLSKYRATITQSEVFEINLQDNLSASPRLSFFINDLIGLDILPEVNNILNSELILKLGDEELQIKKDYLQKSIKFFVNSSEVTTNVYEYIGEKTQQSVNRDVWKDIILDCEKEGITNAVDLSAKLIPQNSASQISASEMPQGLSKEEQDKFTRYQEIKTKLKTMEAEVSSYQNQKKDKETVKKDKERLDREVKAIDDKFSSVTLLIDSQKRIKLELEKFNNIVTDSTISQKVDSIKQSRSQTLYSNLRTFRKTPTNIVEEESNEMPLFIAKWMFVLIFIQLTISLLFFIMTFQLVQLFIGIFSSVAILILMLLVNINRYSTKYSGSFTNDEQVNTSKSIFSKSNPDENRLILNTAWARALQGELEMIEVTINSRLGDKNLQQISEEKEKLLQEQKDVDLKLKNIEEKSLNTEEYYKKRREVDILKIEKENIEFALEGKVKLDSTEQINTDVTADSGLSNLPLLILNCKFISEITELLNSLRQSRQVLLINFA